MFLAILTKYYYIRRLTVSMRKCDFGAIGFFFHLDGSGSKRHFMLKLPWWSIALHMAECVGFILPTLDF